MRGGELFDRIEKRATPYSEKEVARIMFQIVNAVHHMHSLGIAHRGLDFKLLLTILFYQVFIYFVLNN